MPIYGVEQPEILQVDDDIRLRKYDSFYESLRVNEIYDYNIASRKCFETLGFSAYEKTDKGNRFIKSECFLSRLK